MTYARIFWRHASPDEPVEFLHEMDDDRREIRGIRIFLDGRCECVDEDHESEHQGLSELPIPPLVEIAQDPAFEPHEITARAFEERWVTCGGWQVS
jgi:hypothetical protein